MAGSMILRISLQRAGRPCAIGMALGVSLGMGSVAPPALAEDFTFRRVQVGTPQDGRRITVQIDPQEQARRLAPPAATGTTATAATGGGANGAPTGTPSRVAGAQYGWFWDRVSPARAATEGRFVQAIAALGAAPEGVRVRQPSLESLTRIARAQGPALLGATVETRVSPALALAVISVESAGRPQAVSPAGAQGLMQLIPATAERFGVTDAFDPRQNIRGGVRYLDWLLREFDGDVVLALAGYNAGEGAVRRNDGVPPFAETRDYVPKVLAAWQVARGLCRTVPELPSDPCVFALPDPRVASAPASGG